MPKKNRQSIFSQVLEPIGNKSDLTNRQSIFSQRLLPNESQTFGDKIKSLVKKHKNHN